MNVICKWTASSAEWAYNKLSAKVCSILEAFRRVHAVACTYSVDRQLYWLQLKIVTSSPLIPIAQLLVRSIDIDYCSAANHLLFAFSPVSSHMKSFWSTNLSVCPGIEWINLRHTHLLIRHNFISNYCWMKEGTYIHATVFILSGEHATNTHTRAREHNTRSYVFGWLLLLKKVNICSISPFRDH